MAAERVAQGGGRAAVNYRDLTVYKKARELVVGVDQMIKGFPRTAQAELIARQLFGAVTSIGANIAEGKAKNQGREYLRYLTHAQGSANEVDHWLQTSVDCELVSAEQVAPLLSLVLEILKILSTARSTLAGQIEMARTPRLREPKAAYMTETYGENNPPDTLESFLAADNSASDFILPDGWIDPLESEIPNP